MLVSGLDRPRLGSEQVVGDIQRERKREEEGRVVYTFCLCQLSLDQRGHVPPGGGS